jgi:signal transduction histidine kinase
LSRRRQRRLSIVLAVTGSGVCLAWFGLLDKQGLLEPLTWVLAVGALLANIASTRWQGPMLMSGAFVPLMLAVAFLGPAPALAIAVLAELGFWIVDRWRAREPWRNVFGTGNVAGVGLPVLVVGTGFYEFAPEQGIEFYAALALASVAFLALNFCIVALLSALLHGHSVRGRFEGISEFLPVLGINIALAVGAAAVYAETGLLGVSVAFLVVLVFGYMTHQVLQARERVREIARLSRARQVLLGQVVAAEDREREELADALHDEALQNLLAADQDLREARAGSASSLDRARHAIDATVRQIRDAAFRLHPIVLEQAGLEAAVRAVALDCESRAGFTCDIRIDPRTEDIADRLVFSVVRELLVNAMKHSEATEVQLILCRENGRLTIRIQDNGKGMETASLDEAAREGHIGLASLRERASAVGGAMSLSSVTGRGTEISIELPVAQLSASAIWMEPSDAVIPTPRPAHPHPIP